MGTITNKTVTSTVTLGNGSYTSPLTITSTGTVKVSGDAVYGPGTQTWTVDNLGTIEGTGASSGEGIYLADGGNITNGASNATTAFISGGHYGILSGRSGTGTVANYATITGTSSSGFSAAGIDLYNGGIVNNIGTASLISGVNFGIVFTAGAGTVSNAGTIKSTGSIAIEFNDGGSINNTGTVTGKTNGIEFLNHANTVTNSGQISAATYGILFSYTSGLTGTGTLINAGTIIGGTKSGQGAVSFSDGTSVANRVVLEGSGAFTGKVIGDAAAGATNTLELASGTNETLTDKNGTITGAAGTFTSFGILDIDSGAHSTLSGSNTIASTGVLSNSGTLEIASGATVNGKIGMSGTGAILKIDGAESPGVILSTATIANMVQGDTIDLAGVAYSATHSAVYSGGKLSVTENGNTYTLNLSGIVSGSTFHLASDGTSGTDITETTPCYCRGTLIRTEHGEVPVEELKIGDRLVTVSGELRSIRWIGWRAYDGRLIAGKQTALPIIVSAGALGDDLPARDLWVSPEHAFWLDGVLVPARLLLNGLTITQAKTVERVEYFHVELDAHNVIFAEGAAAESYIECNNRGIFQNAAEYAQLYPDAPAEDAPMYARRLEEGDAAAQGIRERLFARACALGRRTSDDPALRLIADGFVVPPLTADDGVYRFTLKNSGDEVWLASRSVVPAETDLASREQRRLGVSIRRITLRDDDQTMALLPNSPHLAEGFHPSEGAHRWTEGMARLPANVLALFAGPVEIEVQLWPSGLRYAEPAARRAVA